MSNTVRPVEPPIVELGNDDRSGSPGVHAALGILEAIVAFGPLGLTDLATEVGVAKSTAHRVGNVLLRRGWAVRRPDGRFDLGIRAIGIGSRSAELPIIVAFRTAAADLLSRHNETVCLAVLDGDESVYVALEETSHAVRLVTHVGSRTPAFASASGRVILSSHTDDAIRAQFGGRSLETPTGRRLRGTDELLTIINAVRRDGYGFNDEETAVGLRSIAAPITNSTGSVLAAITVCAPSSRVSSDRRGLLVDDLRIAAAAMSADIAWLPAWNGTRAEQSARATA